MDEKQALKDIQFIREMIEKTKKATAESWPLSGTMYWYCLKNSIGSG